MRVLVACEFSGTVRDAFIAKGHDAMSCDLLPTEKPGPHYHGDVFDIIFDDWDLMIAHPPCTYVCSSGLHWNKRLPGREQKTVDAISFIDRLWRAPIKKKAFENPIGCLPKRSILGKASQIIQPWQFGHDASKATCIWVDGLPLLTHTKIVAPRIVDGKKRWANQTDSGQNNLGPSADRWALRSVTYQGIADAMAEQWSNQ